MKAPILILLLLMLSSKELRAQDNTGERFVLLEYGFIDTTDWDIRATVSKRWNIVHKPLAGCLVTDELVDSVAIFNQNTFEKLKARYGEDWKVRYDSEIDSAYQLHLKALDEFKEKPLIRKKQGYQETIAHNREYNRMTVQIIANDDPDTRNNVTRIQNLHDNANNIIYRGFPNLFEIEFGRISELSTYELECMNCELKAIGYSDTLPVNQFEIRPKSSNKEALLIIHSAKNDTSIFHFRVALLPDPEIYLNGVRTGESIDISTLDSTVTLTIKYDESVSLRSEFVIRNWEFNSSVGHHVSGAGLGNMLPIQDVESLKTSKPGAQLSFICTVQGPDGILRKKAAIFVVK